MGSKASSLPLPRLPTMASGSDSSSDGLWYSLCFLFFIGLRSSEVLVQEEFWPEAFSTMTDLRGRGSLKERTTDPRDTTQPAPVRSHEQKWGFGPKAEQVEQ